MSHNQAPQARLSTLARFPVTYFLENIAVRLDNSVLITAMNKKELWYVPPETGGREAEPLRLFTFNEPPLGVVEIEPDLFLVFTSNLYTTHESFVHRLDLRAWTPGSSVAPEQICQFPAAARGLNGCCLLGPGVVLVADCFASLIWRMDFRAGGVNPSVRVWLQHESMGYFPGKMKPEQPGVNGIRYAERTQYLYYTSTAKKLFMRAKVNPQTLDPAEEPELVLAGRMADDFCIDEDAEVIYMTTHRQNTIDVVSMDPGLNSGFTQSVAGDPFTERLIGPSSGAWRRGPGDYGHVAYFIMDGGTASPPPSGPEAAQLIKVEFQPLPKPFPGAS